MKITTVTAQLYSQMIAGGTAYLRGMKDRVNNLNVFPVPDGDTGSNMLSTVEGAASVAVNEGETLAEYSAASSNAMMRASRGNSGVILSLFFRGIAKAFSSSEAADTKAIADAFRQGAVSAASAVANPVEGTILTVMRDCIEEPETDDVSEFFANILKKAEAVLAKTPEMLPALKRAKVVDSGGQGFVYILYGMKKVLDGDTSFEKVPDAQEQPTDTVAPQIEEEEIKFAFCTECLLETSNDTDDAQVNALRSKLYEMGDSIVFIYDDRVLKLHIHTNEPLDVLSRVSKLGTFVKCKIENMRTQHTSFVANKGTESEEKKSEKKPKIDFAMVAVCSGKGLENAFHEVGVAEIVSGGQSMNPSTDNILSAVSDCGARVVFVLPNNKNTILAAKQASELAENVDIRVIPTNSVPEGISAAIAFNASRSADENEKIMTNAAKDVTTLSVTRAERDAEVNSLSVKKKQYLGLNNNKICYADDNLFSVIEKLISDVKEYELFTVYYGAGVKKKEAENIKVLIESIVEDAEVLVIEGDQRVYPYIISAE